MFAIAGDIMQATKSWDFGRAELKRLIAQGSGYYEGDLRVSDFSNALAQLSAREPEDTWKAAENARAALRWNQAKPLYERIIREYAQHALTTGSRIRLAECLIKTGLVDNGLSIAGSFLNESPNGPWRGHAHLVIGDAMLEHHMQIVPAAQHYRAIIAPSSWSATAIALRIRKAPAQVQTDFIQGEEVAPDKTWMDVLPDANARLAVIAWSQRKLAESASYANRSAALRPDRNHPLEGGMLIISERARGAQFPIPDIFMRIGGPRTAFALFYAAAMRDSGEVDKATEIYSAVIANRYRDAIDEQTAFARFGIGECLTWRDLSFRQQAIAAYTEFLNEPLQSSIIAPRAILALANVRSANAETDEAVRIMEIGISRYPNSQWTERMIGGRAFIAFNRESADVGIAWYKLFLQKYPTSQWADHARAFIRDLEERKTWVAPAWGRFRPRVIFCYVPQLTLMIRNNQ